MKKMTFTFFAVLLLSFSISAQTTPTTDARTPATGREQTKKKIFRATKEQIAQAQKMLKEKGWYPGAESGKYDAELRAAVKQFQGENNLKKTGSLNRATLEKMGIALTDSQQAIPAAPDSYAAAGTGEKKPRGPIFRATKDQVMQAQKLLKDGGMYAGEQTGKLDDSTRDGLKKYQAANGLKATGTLNQATLEKMGVALTDKQKENSQAQP